MSYGSCGIPYVIEGTVNDFNKLSLRFVDEFKNKYYVNIIVNTLATRIEHLEKKYMQKIYRTKMR